MNLQQFLKRERKMQGFTLLYASLVSALILAIGIAIASFALRGTVFSSSARQSVYAIYAADTGVECASYLDFVENAFGPGSAPATYSCFGQNVTVGGVSYGNTDTFELRFGPVTGEPYCTIVYVRKDNNDSDSSCPVGVECTAVEARGYNTCDTDDPRRIERALRTDY